MHKPAKPLTVEELLTLAGLLKQWRDHLDYTMVMLEGRRWKRKSLLDIYGNLGGVVRDFHLVGAMLAENFFESHRMISGFGIGTMNLPPQALM